MPRGRRTLLSFTSEDGAISAARIEGPHRNADRWPKHAAALGKGRGRGRSAARARSGSTATCATPPSPALPCWLPPAHMRGSAHLAVAAVVQLVEQLRLLAAQTVRVVLLPAARRRACRRRLHGARRPRPDAAAALLARRRLCAAAAAALRRPPAALLLLRPRRRRRRRAAAAAAALAGALLLLLQLLLEVRLPHAHDAAVPVAALPVAASFPTAAARLARPLPLLRLGVALRCPRLCAATAAGVALAGGGGRRVGVVRVAGRLRRRRDVGLAALAHDAIGVHLVAVVACRALGGPSGRRACRRRRRLAAEARGGLT